MSGGISNDPFAGTARSADFKAVSDETVRTIATKLSPEDARVVTALLAERNALADKVARASWQGSASEHQAQVLRQRISDSIPW